MRSDDLRGCGFAAQGQTAGESERHGLLVSYSVTNKGLVRWKLFELARNAASRIDSMKRLVKDAVRRVYLIVGDPRVHHCKVVNASPAEHRHETGVFYDPSQGAETMPTS